MARFEFRFETRYRIAAAPFGITPQTTSVDVTADEVRVRFGPWRLETQLDNIEGTEETGPFAFVKTAGPAHLSFADRGVTFATNGEAGLCVRFREPVPGIDPRHRIRHPGMTVTVARIDDLREALESR